MEQVYRLHGYRARVTMRVGGVMLTRSASAATRSVVRLNALVRRHDLRGGAEFRMEKLQSPGVAQLAHDGSVDEDALERLSFTPRICLDPLDRNGPFAERRDIAVLICVWCFER